MATAAADKLAKVLAKLCEEHGTTVDAARFKVTNEAEAFLLSTGEITSGDCFYMEMVSAPVHDRGTYMCVPHGWKVASIVDGTRILVATTKYEGKNTWYKFDELHPAGGKLLIASSDWVLTPIKAFNLVNAERPASKAMGKIVLGLHFERPQQILRQCFSQRLDQYSPALQQAMKQWLHSTPKVDVRPSLSGEPSKAGVATTTNKDSTDEVQILGEIPSNKRAKPAATVAAVPQQQQQPQTRLHLPLPPQEQYVQQAVGTTPAYPYNTLDNLYLTPTRDTLRKFALHEFFALLPHVSQPGIARVFVNCQLEPDNRVFEDDFIAFLQNVETAASEQFTSLHRLPSIKQVHINSTGDSSAGNVPKIDPRVLSSHNDRVIMFVQSRRPPSTGTLMTKDKFAFHITQLPQARVLQQIVETVFTAALNFQHRKNAGGGGSRITTGVATTTTKS